MTDESKPKPKPRKPPSPRALREAARLARMERARQRQLARDFARLRETTDAALVAPRFEDPPL